MRHQCTERTLTIAICMSWLKSSDLSVYSTCGTICEVALYHGKGRFAVSAQSTKRIRAVDNDRLAWKIVYTDVLRSGEKYTHRDQGEVIQMGI